MNMPLNFGQQVEEKTFDNDVIPKDTLVWMVVNVRGIQNSKETNGRYLDVELTVAEGQPYEKRKIWDKIADPFDAQNSEAWRNMGYGAIRRILEAVRGADPSNPNSYVLKRLEDIGGLTVPVVVGIEKGSKEYPDDKNRVEYLSPHSSVKKIVECYNLLQQGINQYGKSKSSGSNDGQGNLLSQGPAPTPAAMPPAQQPAAQQQPTQNAGPGWLAPQGQAPQGQPPAAAPAPQAAPPQQQAPAQGFTQGQPPAQPQQAAPYQPPAATATSAPPASQPQTGQPSAMNATTSHSEAGPAPFPAAGQPPQGGQQ